MGRFSVKQLKEMAIGLERSGVRFLWVVRTPPPDNATHHSPILATEETRLETLLPEGFLERTKDRGFVVKSWAPQVKVLNHDSVGGFVSHCGWNSTIEAVCGGVPIVAWPLFAEQHVNMKYLVEEIKVAVTVAQQRDGFVSADNLEMRVTELMESKEGKAMRERMKALKEEALRATSEGGSSRVALAKLAATLERPGRHI
ncbi:UDPGT domain-containing protein [Cephalotus follicularis]|uniref:UDPGT domain-containing protein n=1 Tax=Cephalotus follicularis TaxID=3775 RepID=A0A1Q3BXM0_CEPFO|nr:UDPGT domain-containing protein [Cephalotus follicularis]